VGTLDVERSREVVDLGQVDVPDVVCAVVVPDLATGPALVLISGRTMLVTITPRRDTLYIPIDTLNLDSLAILDGGRGGDWRECELNSTKVVVSIFGLTDCLGAIGSRSES